MILVAGATGNLGSEICRRLRERGAAVRALARITSAPEKVERLESIDVEVVRGDLRDDASLDAACRGVITVISTVTMITTAQPGDSFERTDNAGTRALIDAARGSGARHFIFISFDTSAFPDAPLVNAKREAEQYLKESGLTYTIIQAMPFMESWLGPAIGLDVVSGAARLLGSGESRISYVALGDVAELAAQSVTNPAARNATILFGGPDAIRQRDAIRIFEEVFDKPFTVTPIPEEALRAQYNSATDALTKSFCALMLGISHDCVVDKADVRANFPMRLTSVHEYVERLAGKRPKEPKYTAPGESTERQAEAST